jgi:hypothetical protein
MIKDDEIYKRQNRNKNAKEYNLRDTKSVKMEVKQSLSLSLLILPYQISQSRLTESQLGLGRASRLLGLITSTDDRCLFLWDVTIHMYNRFLLRNHRLSE